MGKPIFYGWWIVLATFLAGLLSGGVFATGMSAFFLSLEEEFSAGNRGAISIVLGLAPIQGAILGPLQGFVVDRYGARFVMLAGVLLMGAGWMLASTAQSMGVFIIFFLLIAAGNGMGLVGPPLATVGNWFVKRRGMAFGIATSGFGLGAVLVPMVNFFIQSIGWREAAVVMGGIVWVVGIPIALMMRRRPEDHGMLPDGDAGASRASAEGPTFAETDFTLGEALASRAFWLLNVNFAFRAMIISAVTIHFVPAMVAKDFSPGAAASLFAFLGVMTLPGRLGIGFMSDRLDKRRLGASVSLIIGLSMLIAIWAQSLWQVLLFLTVYGVAIGGGGAAMFAIRGEYFGRRAFATISGFGSIFQALGAMVGTTLAGFTFDRTGNYDIAFYTYAALSLVAIAAIAGARRPIPRRLALR